MNTPFLKCPGCGTLVTSFELPWACPRRDELPDVEHILFPQPSFDVGSFRGGDENAFIRYRSWLLVYRWAMERGLPDARYQEIVRKLDASLVRVDGKGLTRAKIVKSASLQDAMQSSITLFDETHQVSGSRKVRHLFGVAVYMACLEELRGQPFEEKVRGQRVGEKLAVASCGNAALAAAVVAAAAGRPLEVFIPPDAKASVVARLKELGAEITVCPRSPGEVGDPCYASFRRAVSAGAIPFCCQGPDNSLTIDGGQTLAWELIEELHGESRAVNHLLIQVGGGALATACIRAFRTAVAAGWIQALPRIYPVQTEGCYPLFRAWEEVARRAYTTLGRPMPKDLDLVAKELRGEEAAWQGALLGGLGERRAFMRPWDGVPSSLAHGILDDETYDWVAIVEGTLRSGGYPIVAPEGAVESAHALVRAHTGSAASPTGTSGLAGLVHVGSREGSWFALLTGTER